MVPAVAVYVLCLAGGLAMATRRAPLWLWSLALLAITLASQCGLFDGRLQRPTLSLGSLAGWVAVLIFGALCLPLVRRAVLVAPVYRVLRRAFLRITDTARQSLASGTVGFDAELFGGRPDWRKMRAVPPVTLTEAECAFLDGPTEELCRMIDDWRIRHEREIPGNVWSFIRKHGFLALGLGREYGGLGLSPPALSLILGKIAARSPDVFGVLIIPNSLSLAALIAAHGTDDQKRRYLPRLAKGDDLACVAITGPTSGSDAAAMRDIGTVTRATFAGVDTLGIRLSWDKRYIALAPHATLIAIAFRAFDPENLLGAGEERGITVAVVPADHPGVGIGRCHLVSGAAVPFGPTSGEDVFIPLDWVIGGECMVGQGWRMLIDALSVGRAIALPACAAAGIKHLLRTSTAYARIRKQFGFPLAKMEGPEEHLARMVEAAYVSEAARAVTAAVAGQGETPAVISALMKYQMTERLRRCLNDAMDLHGGRAICDGPANYLQSIYQMVPTVITIEGANILTRTLITFLQGAMRSHPYLHAEMQACLNADERRGFAAFERALLDHISFSLSNVAGALFHNLSAGRFGKVPDQAFGTGHWHRQFWRASRNFALVADVTVLLLGAGFRTRQKLTGRLADALSELYLLACVLKRYEDDGAPADDRNIVAFAAQNGLHRFQEAIRGAIANFPVAWAQPLIRAVVFPLGAPYRPASDHLGHLIVGPALVPGPTRDRLTRDIYISNDRGDPTGLLETTLAKVVHADEADRKLERAVRRGTVRRYHGIDWIGDAIRQDVITDAEAELLREAEALTARVIAVDDFDPDEITPNYMTPGHNVRLHRALSSDKTLT